jgi:hypothetical protein
MRKRKKWILLLIILFPSAFWLILETSTINSKKLPYYGPKKLIGKDTSYYTTVSAFLDPSLQLKNFDSINYPILAIAFIKPEYINEGYRLKGLTEYTQYKKNDIDKLPFILIYPLKDSVINNIRDTLKIGVNTIEQCYWRSASFDSLNRRYFIEKPYYVDYSFVVLLDKQRHIRGYYDGRYVSELKRLLGEYKHLRLKEEKNTLLKENEIKTNPSE